ncbi:monooxygenase [Massilia sp. Root418]|uniref:antibiotic biosynthesis monooxygenase family protein n=1 Tax=Massilia sp. Root418 TaxID=1736532 RepID=UPI0006F46168|nr:antibiotic biosynthesis monooxygenase [Massilia sp. Root418]KQW93168.1 monooxygenase [Massilia sp. Root418]
MIYEIASLPVRPDRIDAFKEAFRDVSHLLARAKGYEGHLLTQGIETPSHFTLLVQWHTLEDHTQVFEPSDDHHTFITALQAYFAAEPIVNHVNAAFPGGRVDIRSA